MAKQNGYKQTKQEKKNRLHWNFEIRFRRSRRCSISSKNISLSVLLSIQP